MINNILPSIIESIAAIPRLAETFHLPGIELAPFNAVIKNDEECKRLQTALCNGMQISGNSDPKLQGETNFLLQR